VISAVLVVLFVVLMLAGMPVSIAVALATIGAMLLGGYDLMALPQHMAISTQSIPLLAIPYFILAANLMNGIGVTNRIFRFAQALVGSRRGGLAYVNIIANFFFSGISGAAVANAAGLGSILVKAMSGAGYRPAFAAALSLSGSTLGPIIPPSIMMVVYAVAANVSIAELFVAGLIPGITIALVLIVTVRLLIFFRAVEAPVSVPFSWGEMWRATLAGVPALLAPLIIFLGIVTGVTTPTEAGVVAVAYTLFLGLVYRAVTFAVLWRVLLDSVYSTAIIMFIIAVSSALSYVFISEGTSLLLTDFVMSISDGEIGFLLVTIFILLIIGCFLETLPALLIVVPILLPVAQSVGVDLVHLGVVVIFALLVGIMTPPMGIGLFIMMSVADLKFEDLVRACVPLIMILLACLLLLTFLPGLSLFLPELLF
jgi:tripartite ATP-independent transporter DctM subunit